MAVYMIVTLSIYPTNNDRLSRDDRRNRDDRPGTWYNMYNGLINNVLWTNVYGLMSVANVQWHNVPAVNVIEPISADQSSGEQFFLVDKCSGWLPSGRRMPDIVQWMSAARLCVG